MHRECSHSSAKKKSGSALLTETQPIKHYFGGKKSINSACPKPGKHLLLTPQQREAQERVPNASRTTAQNQALRLRGTKSFQQASISKCSQEVWTVNSIHFPPHIGLHMEDQTHLSKLPSDGPCSVREGFIGCLQWKLLVRLQTAPYLLPHLPS